MTTTVSDISTMNVHGVFKVSIPQLKKLVIEQVKKEVIMGTRTPPKNEKEMEKWFKLNVSGLITKRWMDIFGITVSDILD